MDIIEKTLGLIVGKKNQHKSDYLMDKGPWAELSLGGGDTMKKKGCVITALSNALFNLNIKIGEKIAIQKTY